MTNAELIATIRAEIERLVNVAKSLNTGVTNKSDQFTYGLLSAYKAILSFLSTLEKSETPMNLDGLDEEIQRFLSNATKMDKGEWKGKYPISEMGFGVVARHFYELGKQSGDLEIPNDLEEAAKECNSNLQLQEYFIKGGMLLKEQMLKEAVEGEIENASLGIVYLRKNLVNEGHSTGDKVRVIVLPKED